MKIIKPGRTVSEDAPRVYRARVEATWNGPLLEKADFVVDEFAVVKRRGKNLTLDRACAATNGQPDTTQDVIDREFKLTRNEAIIAFRRKLLRKIDAAYTHEDVISGRVSEAAVVLSGLV